MVCVEDDDRGNRIHQSTAALSTEQSVRASAGNMGSTGPRRSAVLANVDRATMMVIAQQHKTSTAVPRPPLHRQHPAIVKALPPRASSLPLPVSRAAAGAEDNIGCQTGMYEIEEPVLDCVLLNG